MLLCIGFQLSAFTPSEREDVLRLRSTLSANWPLPPVGTPQHATANWTAWCRFLAEPHLSKSNSTFSSTKHGVAASLGDVHLVSRLRLCAECQLMGGRT